MTHCPTVAPDRPVEQGGKLCLWLLLRPKGWIVTVYPAAWAAWFVVSRLVAWVVYLLDN